jgi:hypothetical protein
MNIVAGAVVGLLDRSTIVSVLDISPGNPNDEQSMSVFGTTLSSATHKEYKSLTGFAASILALCQIRELNCMVFLIYQNAVVSQSIHDAFTNINGRFRTEIALDQKLIDKVCFKPTARSAMYL